MRPVNLAQDGRAGQRAAAGQPCGWGVGNSPMRLTVSDAVATTRTA